ncbi:MAG TPA: aldo/keto reductase [Candidatus Cybelea sp.]|nr:aldo/keto reductase [Candidatus Cybelea sp.]
MVGSPLPTRLLGRTGARVSALGLGGEGVLRTFARDEQARAVIEAALAENITYFDSARAYAGSEQYYGATLGRRREDIFLCSKAHDRSFAGALEMLELTLRNMRTDHLDLWQLHDVRTEEDLELMDGERGTYAAFVRAREQGKTRFIGVTGHYDPNIMLEAIRRFDFDTVLLPVNPCEAAVDSFASIVIPEALARGMGVIAMKIFGRGLLLGMREDPPIKSLTDYALTAPVSLAIVGCDDVAQVQAAASAVRSFAPLSPQEQRELERRLRSESKRTLYYRREVP